MGHGKHFIASKKFMKAEGGLGRILAGTGGVQLIGGLRIQPAHRAAQAQTLRRNDTYVAGGEGLAHVRAKDLAEVIYAKLKSDYDAVIDKCEVTVITDPDECAKFRQSPLCCQPRRCQNPGR